MRLDYSAGLYYYKMLMIGFTAAWQNALPEEIRATIVILLTLPVR
jgi:hypothetical protein